MLSATSAVGGQDADAAAASVAVDLADRVFQGEQTTATATFRNTGTKPKDDVVLTPVGARGLDARVGVGRPGRYREAGDSATAEFVFEVTDAAAADLQTVTVNAAYTSQQQARTVSGANQLYVAYGSLAGAVQRRVRSPTSRPRRPATSTAGGPRSRRRRSQPQG